MTKGKVFFIVMCLSTCAYSQDFEFNWSSGRDMAGAMMMCAPFGMIPGECPWVAVRCNLPPMRYLRCDWDGCDWVSKCFRKPKFGMSPSDVKKAQCYARKKAGLESC